MMAVVAKLEFGDKIQTLMLRKRNRMHVARRIYDFGAAQNFNADQIA